MCQGVEVITSVYCVFPLNEFNFFIKELKMKTITFISYDKYPKTVRKSHIFKKRFSSLADVAKFLRSSCKIYLNNPMNEFSKDELRIISMKVQSLNRRKV